MSSESALELWQRVAGETVARLEQAGGSAVITENEGADDTELDACEAELATRFDAFHRSILRVSNGIGIECAMPLENYPYCITIGSIVEVQGASQAIREHREIVAAPGSDRLPRAVVFAISASVLVAYQREVDASGRERWPVDVFDNGFELLYRTEFTFETWLATIPDRVSSFVAICKSGGLRAFLNRRAPGDETPLPF